MTFFDSYSYDGVSAGIWVIHTGPKSGGELVTLFDSYSYDGVSAGIWVINTGLYAVKSHHQCNQAGLPRWP